MTDKAIALFGLALALLVGLIGAGIIGEGARNMNELFHGVQIEKESGDVTAY